MSDKNYKELLKAEKPKNEEVVTDPEIITETPEATEAPESDSKQEAEVHEEEGVNEVEIAEDATEDVTEVSEPETAKVVEVSESVAQTPAQPINININNPAQDLTALLTAAAKAAEANPAPAQPEPAKEASVGGETNTIVVEEDVKPEEPKDEPGEPKSIVSMTTDTAVVGNNTVVVEPKDHTAPATPAVDESPAQPDLAKLASDIAEQAQANFEEIAIRGTVAQRTDYLNAMRSLKKDPFNVDSIKSIKAISDNVLAQN